MPDNRGSSTETQNKPESLKARKTPVLVQEIKEARLSFLVSAQRYRRLSKSMKCSTIIFSLFASLAAALEFKWPAIALTASISAINSFDSAFHVHEMSFKKSIAGLTTWKLLDEFRLKNAEIGDKDDDGFRQLEHYIRGKIKAIWEESITAELRTGHLSGNASN